MSEQEIINKMGHMFVVGIAYMNNHNLDHPEITDLLVTGFSGTFHGWWDSYLMEDSKESIKTIVKKNDEGFPIFDESIGRGIRDGVNTLIYTILKHFVGTPSNISSRMSYYLNNLRCPTMSESLEDDFSSLSNSCYQSADDSSDSPNIKIGCRDSCCNVIKSVNVLTKSEENESLLIKLISQIENPKLQKEYLDKLKKNLIKDETSKKLKSSMSFEETLERFNIKKSKNLTVNDLQHEITIVKQEIIELKNEFKNFKSDNHNIKQELLLLKIDKNLDKQQSNNEQD